MNMNMDDRVSSKKRGIEVGRKLLMNCRSSTLP